MPDLPASSSSPCRRPRFSQRLSCPAPTPGASLRLFCLHHAGGDTSFFRNWPRRLPPSVEVWAPILPGKGQRWGEEPFRDWRQAVDEIVACLSPLTDLPFAIFGHSLGALLGFEAARRLSQDQRPLRHLFVSGMGAPHRDRDRPLHDLPDDELVEAIRELDGTPEEVLESPEALAMILPQLRADLAVRDSYQFPGGSRLGCPIAVYMGQEDACSEGDVEAWREMTTGPCQVSWFPGGHFFLLEGGNESRMLELLGRAMGRKTPLDAWMGYGVQAWCDEPE